MFSDLGQKYEYEEQIRSDRKEEKDCQRGQADFLGGISWHHSLAETLFPPPTRSLLLHNNLMIEILPCVPPGVDLHVFDMFVVCNLYPMSKMWSRSESRLDARSPSFSDTQIAVPDSQIDGP